MRPPKRKPTKPFVIRRKFGENSVFFPIPFETYNAEKYGYEDSPWERERPFKEPDMVNKIIANREAIQNSLWVLIKAHQLFEVQIVP